MTDKPLVTVFGSLHYDIMVDSPDRPRKGETLAGSAWMLIAVSVPSSVWFGRSASGSGELRDEEGLRLIKKSRTRRGS